MVEANPQNGSQRESTQGRSAATTSGTQDGQKQGGTRSNGRRSVAPWRTAREMTTPSASPFAAMMQLSRDMDRMFESFFGRRLGMPSLFAGWPSETFGMGEAAVPTLWSPQIEVAQRDDAIVIRADLPGVSRDDVRIEATDDGVAISGERRSQREEGDQRYHFAECTYGSFYRSIPLPEGADIDAAKASMRDGVLEVTIPLEQSRRRRQIQIES
jgi:HSP20 family protein